MWYVYFRFYIDEDDIKNGLNSYCTSWENMYPVGYNYQEYKCFVDNVGGFEHWAGDLSGYISQTRETGFLDGSPSDAVFDQTMLMGSGRLMLDKNTINLLNGYPTNTKFLFRKIIANDAGIAHKINMAFGGLQNILHPVMYTLDTNKIEIIKQVASGVVDSSDVTSYSTTIDVSAAIHRPAIHENNDMTLTNPNDMFDTDVSTFTQIDSTLGGYSDIIFDCGKNKQNISIYFHNYKGGAYYNTVFIYHSLDAVSWTLLDNAPNDSDASYCFSARGLDFRYVKIHFYTYADHVDYKSRVKVYELIVS